MSETRDALARSQLRLDSLDARRTLRRPGGDAAADAQPESRLDARPESLLGARLDARPIAERPPPDDAHTCRLQVGEVEMLVASAGMRAVVERVRELADDRLPVLIEGRTGVGKELVARLLHQLAPWATGPLISVNCGGLPGELVESELFGHEKGSFSGAIASKPGLFEAACGGTLILDEIGEMPAPLQSHLLHVLDGRPIRRVGGLAERPYDVRIVAATNRDLEAEVAAGRFREDLYFRLAGACLRVPPLCERAADIPVLAQAALAARRAARGQPPATIATDAMLALVRYPWPGNVRELNHTMAGLALRADARVIELAHLPEKVRAGAAAPVLAPAATREAAREPEVAAKESGPGRPRGRRRSVKPPLSVRAAIPAFERRLMLDALIAADWVQVHAARAIDMPRRTFITKMKRYGLRRPEVGGDDAGAGAVGGTGGRAPRGGVDASDDGASRDGGDGEGA